MGQRNKEVTPRSSSATKAAAWWEQVGPDSAPRMFVLVALALHPVLDTGSPVMPIPCSAPPAPPAVPPAPTTPAQEGSHGGQCPYGSHRTWVTWKSHQREITKMGGMEQQNPGGTEGV